MNTQRPKSHEIDMLHGPLVSGILKFALPFAASSILQQMFNAVDVAVVGRFASSEALAAVGANTFLINLFINLFVGISVGANVVISHHIGQNDDNRTRKAVHTTMILAVLSGFTMLVTGLLIAAPVLELMDTPANVLSDSVLYLRIYMCGTPFFMIYNFGAAILRSKGDTKRPLYILIVAGLINTALNLLFVIVFHMSVDGVAIATGISNAFSALAILVLLKKEPEPFKLHFSLSAPDKAEISRILKIGLPAGLQSMVFSFSNVCVQTAINGYGSAAVAGAAISVNFDSFCYFFITAFCGAAITFTGQNFGAGNVMRCRHIFTICMIGGALTCFLGNMMFYTQRDFFLGLFTTDPQVVHYAVIRMSWVLIFQPMTVSYEISAAAMRGMNYSLEPALLTILGTCVLRLVWVFFVGPIWPGFAQLMYCYPISWVVTGTMVMTCYIIVSRRAYRRIASQCAN